MPAVTAGGRAPGRLSRDECALVAYRKLVARAAACLSSRPA